MIPESHSEYVSQQKKEKTAKQRTSIALNTATSWPASCNSCCLAGIRHLFHSTLRSAWQWLLCSLHLRWMRVRQCNISKCVGSCRSSMCVIIYGFCLSFLSLAVIDLWPDLLIKKKVVLGTRNSSCFYHFCGFRLGALFFATIVVAIGSLSL